jgi:hypothetical protein
MSSFNARENLGEFNRSNDLRSLVGFINRTADIGVNRELGKSDGLLQWKLKERNMQQRHKRRYSKGKGLKSQMRSGMTS